MCYTVSRFEKQTIRAKENEMLGKFNKLQTARNFSNRTIKASAIVLGDDNKYWVTNLAEMTKLEKAGYTVVK